MKDNKIEKAILYATEKHMGQTRKDGTPYIYHPIAVAEELRKAGYDEKYQLTGILHDTLEDTDATVEELAQFGEDVLEAVKLLTRPDGCDEDYYVSCILQDKMAAVVKSVDKIHNVMSAAYCGPTGYVLTDSEERYARRYIKKANMYYYGKFNRALDRAISNAESALRCVALPAQEPLVKDAGELMLFSEEEALRKQEMKELHDSLTDRPDFTNPEIVTYKIGETYCVAYGYEANQERLRQWTLTEAGWIPSKLDLVDYMDDFWEITMDDLKEAIAKKKAEGFFHDYVTEDLM